MSAKPKVLLATAVLLFGVVGAYCFRKPAPPADEPRAPLAETAPTVSPLHEDSTPVVPQLLGRIDPVESGSGSHFDEWVPPDADQPDMRDPYRDMPATPPWSGFEDRHSIEARATSMRTGERFGPGGPAKESSRPKQRTHRVADGDTLSSLALRYLGRSDRYQEIYSANQDVLTSPDVLPIGSLLKIPDPGAPPVATSPAPMVEISSDTLRAAREQARGAGGATARTYRVQAHDTLSGIARQFYGDAQRFRDVLDANRDKLRQPEDLREGMELIIP